MSALKSQICVYYILTRELAHHSQVCILRVLIHILKKCFLWRPVFCIRAHEQWLS